MKESDVRAVLEPVIRGVGLREVSRRCGVPASRVSEWFAGRWCPSFDQISAMAEAVGARLDLKVRRSRRAPARDVRE